MTASAGSPATDAAHRWRSSLLGEPKRLDLAQGGDRVLRARSGTNGGPRAWLGHQREPLRKVVDALHGDFRCLALDLPLGSHSSDDASGGRPRPGRNRRPHRLRVGAPRAHRCDPGRKRLGRSLRADRRRSNIPTASPASRSHRVRRRTMTGRTTVRPSADHSRAIGSPLRRRPKDYAIRNSADRRTERPRASPSIASPTK